MKIKLNINHGRKNLLRVILAMFFIINFGLFAPSSSYGATTPGAGPSITAKLGMSWFGGRVIKPPFKVTGSFTATVTSVSIGATATIFISATGRFMIIEHQVYNGASQSMETKIKVIEITEAIDVGKLVSGGTQPLLFECRRGSNILGLGWDVKAINKVTAYACFADILTGLIEQILGGSGGTSSYSFGAEGTIITR